MKQITHNGKIVAISHKSTDWKKELDFLTSNEDFIQCGTWWYDAGKNLKAHEHIFNERTVTQTQETIIVLSGKLRIDLYDPDCVIFYQEEVGAGDVFVILDVGHGYQIIEDDTRVVEVKNGPFISVEKDKRLI